MHLLLCPSQNLSKEQSSLDRHSTLKQPIAMLLGSPRCPAGHEHTAKWSKTLQTALGPHWTCVPVTQGSVHFPRSQISVSLQSPWWLHSLGVTHPGSRNGSPTVPRGHAHLYDPKSLIHWAVGWHGSSLHSSMSRQPDGLEVKPLPHLKQKTFKLVIYYFLQIKIGWEKREYLRKFYTQNWREKRPRGRPQTKWVDQIWKDIEMRGENWYEIQENRKWGNRDSWRFLCKSTLSLGMT